MMRDDPKRLSDGSLKLGDVEVRELLEALQPYLDRQAKLSRRTRALLASSGDDGCGRQWFVLRVAPQADKAVDKLLGEARIERWMPVRRKAWKRPHTSKMWVQSVPGLPGYIFVRVLSCDEIWSGLRALKGVVGVLCGAVGPLPVGDAKVLKFKLMCDDDGTDREAYSHLFRKGDRVTIDVGPYASFPGILEADPESDVARVMVWIFGRAAPVTVPLANLQKSI